MLSALMGTLRRLSPAPVTQQEIETLIGIENQIRLLKHLADHQAASILDRLLAGSSVEPGPHTATADATARGRKLVTRLHLDGH